MEEFEKKDFEKILKKNGLEIRRWMKASDSDVARVYDRNIETIPVTVDLYGSYARIVDYSDNGYSEDEITEIKDIVSRYLYVELANVIFTERKKREGREQHEKSDESTVVICKENGLEFECELTKYVDTGLFLDHMYTRDMVKASAEGVKVLNLFCYTGSFSIYAAEGGADSVTSVDLSNVYAEWTRRNLERNGFLDKERYKVIAMDARAFLNEAVAKGERYDLVILDPPAFSNSHKAEDFDVQKDYLWFLSQINKILSKIGVVIFSENLSGFRLEKKALEPYFKVREITKEVLAPGFSSKRKQMRVWILEKTATVENEIKAVGNKRKMDELKDESLDRLTLADEQPKRERRNSKPRSFEFDSREESSERGVRRESYSKDDRRSERRDTHARDHERRASRRFDAKDRDRDSYSRSDRPRRDYRDDRKPDFSRRDDGRDSYRDRDDRRDYRPRRDFEDRRDFPRRDDYRSDRSERRYSDRDSYRSDDRNDDRRYFDRDRRDERRDWRDRPRKEYRDGERRGGNFRSQGKSGDNETSRLYRSERKKTSAPKPYGYDSFMETKNREKATAFWLQNQEVAGDADDNKR